MPIVAQADGHHPDLCRPTRGIHPDHDPLETLRWTITAPLVDRLHRPQGARHNRFVRVIVERRGREPPSPAWRAIIRRLLMAVR